MFTIWLLTVCMMFGAGQVVFRGVIKTFFFLQLHAAAGNKVDENAETEPYSLVQGT